MIMIGVAGKRGVGREETQQTSINNSGRWVKMEPHTIFYFGIC